MTQRLTELIAYIHTDMLEIDKLVNAHRQRCWELLLVIDKHSCCQMLKMAIEQLSSISVQLYARRHIERPWQILKVVSIGWKELGTLMG